MCRYRAGFPSVVPQSSELTSSGSSPWSDRVRTALGLGVLMLLAACAHPSDPLASYPTAEQQILPFYEAHALERSGTCTTPYISDIVRVEAVREDDRQLVLDVDYLYDSRVRPAQYGLAACWNFASRRFTFEKDAGELRLTGMTGEQRA